MVCYCPERKIIYIHNPKTGGLTIEEILVKYYNFKHFSFNNGRYEFLRNDFGKIGIYRYILENSYESKIYDLKSFFKFTFVRNPVDRGLSALRYLKERYLYFFPKTFEKFLLECETDPYLYIHFVNSQSDHLKDEEGLINFDFIGRFENFNSDLKKVLFEVCKLPEVNFDEIHINSSKLSNEMFSYEEVSNYIREKHREDFLNFNFKN